MKRLLTLLAAVLVTTAVAYASVGAQTFEDTAEELAAAATQKMVYSGEPKSTADKHVHNVSEIYIMNPDGTGLKQLTNSGGINRFPVLSPDGSKIAFGSDRRGGDMDVYIMDAKDRDGDGEGDNLRCLVCKGGVDDNPDFSPDGKEVLLESFTSNTYTYDIVSVKADGSEEPWVVLRSNRDDWAPVYDPSVKSPPYAYSFTSQANGEGDIYYIVSGSGNLATMLTPDTPSRDQHSAFSPDGSEIAFQSDRGNTAYQKIFTMTKAGNNQTKIVSYSNGDALFPTYSPDGRRIGFHALNYAYYNLHSVKRDGTRPKQYTSFFGDEMGMSWGIKS